MRGLRQTTVSRAPTIRGRDMRKRTPIKVGINDTSSEGSGMWGPSKRGQFRGDTATGHPITPGWARKYRSAA